jgi:hypothetical protein
MKRVFFFLAAYFVCASISFAQSNKIGGGTNFYQSLIGQTLPSLTAPTGRALVYVDYSFTNDGVITSLNENGFAVDVASDWNDFNNKLANGSFELVVAFAQNYSAVTDGLNVSNLGNYINNGGSMIFATWTDDDLAVANLMDAGFTGVTNLSTVTITDPVMANGLTNPFTLSNPGWGIYSMGLTALTGGEVVATFENGNAAMVRGNNGRTIMVGYLSDTPATMADRDEIFSNVVFAADVTVPIPYGWIIAAFSLIVASVLFSKRKVLFS